MRSLPSLDLAVAQRFDTRLGIGQALLLPEYLPGKVSCRFSLVHDGFAVDQDPIDANWVLVGFGKGREISNALGIEHGGLLRLATSARVLGKRIQSEQSVWRVRGPEG